MPSVIGGGETGNSWLTPMAKETKKTPDRNAKPMAYIVFFIFYENGGEGD
jgi:hypothetical protein